MTDNKDIIAFVWTAQEKLRWLTIYHQTQLLQGFRFPCMQIRSSILPLTYEYVLSCVKCLTGVCLPVSVCLCKRVCVFRYASFSHAVELQQTGESALGSQTVFMFHPKWWHCIYWLSLFLRKRVSRWNRPSHRHDTQQRHNVCNIGALIAVKLRPVYSRHTGHLFHQAQQAALHICAATNSFREPVI